MLNVDNNDTSIAYTKSWVYAQQLVVVDAY